MTSHWNMSPTQPLPDEATPSERKRQEEQRRKRGLCPACGRPMELRELVAHVAVRMQCPARSCLRTEYGLRGSALYRVATGSVGRVR